MPETAEIDLEHLKIDQHDPLARAIERSRWNTWWQITLVAIVVYGIVEKLVLPALQGYLQIGGPLKDWRPDLEALLTGFVGFPGIYAFYVWSARSVPDLLVSFHHDVTRDATTPEPHAGTSTTSLFLHPDKYIDFLGKERQSRWWFSRWWWTLVSVIGALALTIGLFHFYLWDQDDPKPVTPWWSEGEPLSRVVALGLLALVLYAGIQVLIREAILGVVLARMWNDEELKDDLVLRSKQDDVGGLGPLADHVGKLIVLASLVAITFAMASYLPALRQEEVGDFAGMIVVIWSIYAVIVPGVFFGLIWPAHRAMRDQRDERLSRVAGQIDAKTVGIEQRLANDDLDGLESAMSELERLRELHGWLQADLPTWPLWSSIRRQLSWSAIVPGTYTAITFILDIVPIAP